MVVAVINKTLSVISLEDRQFNQYLVEILHPFENITKAKMRENYMTVSLVIVFTGSLIKMMNNLTQNKETALKTAHSLFIAQELKEVLRERFKNL